MPLYSSHFILNIHWHKTHLHFYHNSLCTLYWAKTWQPILFCGFLKLFQEVSNVLFMYFINLKTLVHWAVSYTKLYCLKNQPSYVHLCISLLSLSMCLYLFCSIFVFIITPLTSYFLSDLWSFDLWPLDHPISCVGVSPVSQKKGIPLAICVTTGSVCLSFQLKCMFPWSCFSCCAVEKHRMSVAPILTPGNLMCLFHTCMSIPKRDITFI